MKNPVKHREKRDDAERLHQCLHQIAELVERNDLELLASLLLESLGPDALERLATALTQRMASPPTQSNPSTPRGNQQGATQ